MKISKLESARQSLLEARARHMRFNQSPSEQRLWRAIRGRRLGVQFRRQVPLGRFIVDFFAPEVGVAVEVSSRPGSGRHARPQAPHQIRTRRFPPSGSSAGRARGTTTSTGSPGPWASAAGTL